MNERPDDEITLREAAKFVKVPADPDKRPAEAVMTLEAMLGASRRGKTISA